MTFHVCCAFIAVGLFIALLFAISCSYCSFQGSFVPSFVKVVSAFLCGVLGSQVCENGHALLCHEHQNTDCQSGTMLCGHSDSKSLHYLPSTPFCPPSFHQLMLWGLL